MSYLDVKVCVCGEKTSGDFCVREVARSHPTSPERTRRCPKASEVGEKRKNTNIGCYFLISVFFQSCALLKKDKRGTFLKDVWTDSVVPIVDGRGENSKASFN